MLVTVSSVITNEFEAHYCSIVSFVADRTLRGMLNDNAGTIDRLRQCLLDLKRDFDGGVTIQTAIVSFRTHEDVATIRAYYFLSLHLFL
jgi:hypothetical protein